MVKVKICGLINPEDALAAADAGADILGFIFAFSQRRADPDIVKNIVAQVPAHVKISALFVDEAEDVVAETVRMVGRVDMLQFHGDETLGYCNMFFGKEIIKVIRVKDAESIEAIKSYGGVNYILLDSYSELYRGGTGQRFDWDLAVKAKEYNMPIILSGGLTPDNVKEAVEKVRPFAVDVSSGVESIIGKKDHGKLRSFIERAKSVNI